ncbi:MAG: hypothetical protein ACRDNG_10745, partial [Gaiellaceae bacterium]
QRQVPSYFKTINPCSSPPSQRSLPASLRQRAERLLWDSAAQEHRGIGLRAYTLDGKRRFQVLDERPIAGVQVLRDRVFALLDDAGSAAVVDIRSGKVLREFTVDEEAAGLPDLVVRSD